MKTVISVILLFVIFTGCSVKQYRTSQPTTFHEKGNSISSHISITSNNKATITINGKTYKIDRPINGITVTQDSDGNNKVIIR